MKSDAFSGAVSRGISLNLFDEIKDRYGDDASWAVWDKPESLNKAGIGNLDILDPRRNPELLGILHTDLVLVGLNGSRPMEGAEKLSNFHDTSAKGMDYKLRHAAHGTALWGAYLTDVIKKRPITDSKELRAYLKANPGKEQESVASFRQELNEIRAINPILVPMGREDERIVRRYFYSEFKIIPIIHYSNYIGIERYCARVWDLFPKSR